jgi:molybdate transport system regulatory protein
MGKQVKTGETALQAATLPRDAGEARIASLFLRIKFGDRAHLGPGKVRLMELIAEHGSISAAGKAMGMSYRRAWLIVDGLNGLFAAPLIVKQTGGSGGGGASLTAFGHEIVKRYRAIEARALAAAAEDIKAISEGLA